MNVQKKINLSGSLGQHKPRKEKVSSLQKHSQKDINIKTYKMSQKDIYNTITIKNNKSANKNQFNKNNNNRRKSMLSIKNDKSSKLFKVKKGKINPPQHSLNLSNEESLSKNKQAKILYNTINAINPRIKIFKNNNIIIKDINKKNKSIQNSSRMKFSHIRCNTYSPIYKENKDDYRNKSNNKKERYNNIIINFFNAPVNKYNEEFYFNNINDMNKIIKNKKIKKKVINIFNHANIKSTHKDNTKNIYPFFSSINHGINYSINNHNDFEFQIYKNKKKTIFNEYENMKTIFNNHSISKIKKSPFKETLGNYSNKYRKIKFIKNKKPKNISLNIKINEDNRLKTILKKTKNYNNINTLNKYNIIDIKKDHFIHTRALKTEHKTKNKHILYNLLFKSSTKPKQNQSVKSKSINKSKKSNILSLLNLRSFKSIDIERNTKQISKFDTLITEAHQNKKNAKNKFLKKSKGQIYIKEKNNIQYHQKNNIMKTIMNNNNNIHNRISMNNNLFKCDEKNKEKNNIIKPILLQSNVDSDIISDKSLLSSDKDPKYLNEYIDEILCNLFLEEKTSMEKIGYQISSDVLINYGINPETRTCLIDSLIDLQKIFNFNERTLFITLQIFDKYLVLSIINENAPKIKEENLDIILTTALLIASKLEESVLYKLSDYLGILSDKYTIEDIKIMENKIMNAFDFSAISPTALDFFEVLAEKSKLNEEQNKKGLFLLNIILLDINISQIPGSVIAYAIVIIIQGEEYNINKRKNLIKILNSLFKKKNKNNNEYMDSLNLMNNVEKIDELCNLIQIYAEGILKTEYNHISIKFNCEKNDYLTKKNVHRSI